MRGTFNDYPAREYAQVSGSAQPLCEKGGDIVCSAVKAVAGLNIRRQSNDLMRTRKGHIGTKISINPYAPRKVQLPGLGVN